MAEATTSLPVPVSPRTSSETRDRATSAARSSSAANAGKSVRIPGRAGRSSRPSRLSGPAAGTHLEQGAVRDRDALDAPAVEQRAVLRAGVLDHPFAEQPLQARVGPRHVPVGQLEAQRLRPCRRAPLRPLRLTAPQHHRVHRVEADARTRLEGLVAAQHDEEVWFPPILRGAPADSSRDGARIHRLHCRTTGASVPT